MKKIIKYMIILKILVINYCKDIKRPDLLLSLLLNKGQLGIITSDFSASGRFYTLNDQGFLSFNYTPIHSDASGFNLDNKIYILNRLNRDTVQVLDPEFFYQTIKEFSTGNGTNPHGIAVYQNKAYITLYEKPYILVVDRDTGLEIKKIDISSYTDTVAYFTPDGIPEASGIIKFNNKIYVALQRLDRTDPYRIFPVTDYSSLLEIDPENDQVINQYIFQYKNPISKLKIYNITGEDCIFVANAGNVGFNFATDGAIEGFCPVSNTSLILLNEYDVKADILDFVIIDSSSAFALIEYSDFSTSIIKFNPLNGNIIKNIINYKNNGFAAGLEYLNGNLYIGENSQYPLIRIYNIQRDLFTQILPLEQNPTEIFAIP
ncbi:MAG: hypothetical protein KatS3mg129_2188 [Leptospiraceae bacterium]|nr:MAG: hypothetical protein KatS3mg129_2188 [Leptospiraceae bacterium]